MRKKLLSLNLALLMAVLLVLPSLTLTSSAVGGWQWGEPAYIKVQTQAGADPELVTIYNVASMGDIMLYEAFLYHEGYSGTTSVLAADDFVATGYTCDSETYTFTALANNIAAKTPENAPVLVPEKYTSQSENPMALCISPTLKTVTGDKDYVVVEAAEDGTITFPETNAFATADEQKVLLWEAQSRRVFDNVLAGATTTLPSEVGNTVWLAGEGAYYITFYEYPGVTYKAYSSKNDRLNYSQRNRIYDNDDIWVPVGWNSKADFTGKTYNERSTVSDVLDGAALTADVYRQFVKAPENFYELYSAGGLDNGSWSEVKELPATGVVTLPTTIRSGVEALYWDLNGVSYPAGTTVEEVESGAMFYGTETYEDMLYACLDGNGGAYGFAPWRNPYDYVYCTDGTDGFASDFLFQEYVPYKAGAVLTGYQAVGSKKIYDLNADVLTAIQAERTGTSKVVQFRALYEEITGNAIEYFGNGAVTQDGKAYAFVDSITGTSVNAAENMFVAPEGKRFAGWNTYRSGYGNDYAAGDAVPLDDVTALYAQWEDAPEEPEEPEEPEVKPEQPGTTTKPSQEEEKPAEVTVQVPQQAITAAKGEAVALPMEPVTATDNAAKAPTVTVKLPAGTTAKVEVPVEDVTPGTVAVLVKADGTEEIVRTSVVSENGVVLTVEDGATLKIVDNTKEFDDVSEVSWCSDAVAFVSSRELFQGTSDAQFSPDASANRAMIVTVLARLEGENTEGGTNWYDKGRDWAMEAGISDGSSMDTSITREQLATMLYRYAQNRGMDVSATDTLSSFTDAAAVSDYASEALGWAVANGIITGKPNQVLDPQAGATRAETAAMLMRFCQLI